MKNQKEPDVAGYGAMGSNPIIGMEEYRQPDDQHMTFKPNWFNIGLIIGTVLFFF